MHQLLVVLSRSGYGSNLRIIFAHNRYLHRGGEDESRRQEINLLQARGHEVVEYVVDNRDVKQSGLIALGVRSVWSSQQAKLIQQLIETTKPDVLKVDNYFPILSPSIFSAAQAVGVPTVLSVRNYRLICPSANLFRDGAICSECVGKKVAYPAVIHRCYRNSVLQSSSVVLSNAFAHLQGTWLDSVDRFVAVSEFVKSELIRGGFKADKISVKPNFIVDSGIGHGLGGYALFVGRLAEEKGIRTLIDAWRTIGSKLQLKVIGVGPLDNLLQKEAAVNPGIELLGWKDITEVCEYLGSAKALIFPSEWLEPFGRSIVEAYSKGTPVLAANTAPMPDMVADGETGYLFKVGDGDDLARRLLMLIEDDAQYRRMRVAARERYLTMYSEEQNYTIMMEIFGQVVSRRSVTADSGWQ